MKVILIKGDRKGGVFRPVDASPVVTCIVIVELTCLKAALEAQAQNSASPEARTSFPFRFLLSDLTSVLQPSTFLVYIASRNNFPTAIHFFIFIFILTFLYSRPARNFKTF
jgi:hypothetical protein